MAMANVRKAIRKDKIGRRKLAAKVTKQRAGTEGSRQKNLVRVSLGHNRV